MSYGHELQILTLVVIFLSWCDTNLLLAICEENPGISFISDSVMRL